MKRLGKDTVEDTERPSRSTEVPKAEIKTEPESEPESTREAQNSKVTESDIWRSKPKEGVEKSREDEFEEYLADLFL